MGLIIGLVLALTGYTAGLVLRTRAANPLPVLCSLIFLVSAGSMVLGVGYSRSRPVPGPAPMGPDGNFHAMAGWGGPYVPPPPTYHGSRDHRRGPHSMGAMLMQEADLDQDGRLTPDEAAEFVRKADRGDKGWADAGEIDLARKEPASPPPPHRVEHVQLIPSSAD